MQHQLQEQKRLTPVDSSLRLRDAAQAAAILLQVLTEPDVGMLLCAPQPSLSLFPACHRDLLSVSRVCLDPLPFLLPHIRKCTCWKINGSSKTKSNVCFGMLLIHLFGSSYCSSGLPWSSLSAHPAALICSLNFCRDYISIPVNSQGCCLNAINPLSQWEFLY